MDTTSDKFAGQRSPPSLPAIEGGGRSAPQPCPSLTLIKNRGAECVPLPKGKVVALALETAAAYHVESLYDLSFGHELTAARVTAFVALRDHIAGPQRRFTCDRYGLAAQCGIALTKMPELGQAILRGNDVHAVETVKRALRDQALLDPLSSA